MEQVVIVEEHIWPVCLSHHYQVYSSGVGLEMVMCYKALQGATHK